MIIYENHCCDCAAPGYPCIGDSCPHVNVPVYYCDCCNSGVYAEYDIEGEHYCEECARKYLKEVFSNLTLLEQAETLGLDMINLEG